MPSHLALFALFPPCAFQGRATPLHLAAARNHAEVASLLLEKGADARALRESNSTPLHDACGVGALGVAKILLEAKADAEAEDSGGVRPLHIAARYGSGD